MNGSKINETEVEDDDSLEIELNDIELVDEKPSDISGK